MNTDNDNDKWLADSDLDEIKEFNLYDPAHKIAPNESSNLTNFVKKTYKKIISLMGYNK